MRQYSSWKKQQIKRDWRNLVSIFLTIVILAAIFNGFSKRHFLKDNLTKSSWEGRGPLAIAVSSVNPAVFIYEKDPKKLVVLTLNKDTIFDSGRKIAPLEKVSDTLRPGRDFSKAISKIFGAKIESFVDLKNQETMDSEKSLEAFKNFASITTPFLILTTGYKNNIEDTNITRLDALRLWWQVKSLSAKDVYFKDLSAFREEIIDESGSGVLGADSLGLNKEISEYLENIDIVKEGYRVKIRNESGNIQSAVLASYFAESVGAKVTETLDAPSQHRLSSVLETSDRSSFTASYLAKIFGCAINKTQDFDQDKEITLILGQDFAQSWFE